MYFEIGGPVLEASMVALTGWVCGKAEPENRSAASRTSCFAQVRFSMFQRTLACLLFLFRQSLRSPNLKSSHRRRSDGTWLTATDRQRVLAFSDDRFASFSDHAQVAILQFEPHILGLARLQMHALESAQSTQWRARHTRKAEVKLHYFIALAIAGIGNGHFRDERITRVDCLFREAKPTVGKCGVAQAVAKGIERLSLGKAVGGPRHALFFERR